MVGKLEMYMLLVSTVNLAENQAFWGGTEKVQTFNTNHCVSLLDIDVKLLIENAY